MGCRDEWGSILLLDASAVPILFGVQLLADHLNGVSITAIGIIVCVTVSLLARRIFRQSLSPWLGFFVMCTFTCVIDLFLALETVGVLRGYADLWLNFVEEYLSTSWGAAVNFYDASVHFFIYFKLISNIRQGRTNRVSQLGLFWAGSLLNSMIVLLSSAVLGQYPTKPGIIMNIPYLLAPIFYLITELRKSTWEGSTTSRSGRLLVLSYSVLFALFTLACMGVGAQYYRKIPYLVQWSRFRINNISQLAQAWINLVIIAPLYAFAAYSNPEQSWKLTHVAHGFLSNCLVTQGLEHLGVRHWNMQRNMRRPPLSHTVFLTGLLLIIKDLIFSRSRVGEGRWIKDEELKLADKMV